MIGRTTLANVLPHRSWLWTNTIQVSIIVQPTVSGNSAIYGLPPQT